MKKVLFLQFFIALLAMNCHARTFTGSASGSITDWDEDVCNGAYGDATQKCSDAGYDNCEAVNCYCQASEGFLGNWNVWGLGSGKSCKATVEGQKSGN